MVLQMFRGHVAKALQGMAHPSPAHAYSEEEEEVLSEEDAWNVPPRLPPLETHVLFPNEMATHVRTANSKWRSLGETKECENHEFCKKVKGVYPNSNKYEWRHGCTLCGRVRWLGFATLLLCYFIHLLHSMSLLVVNTFFS